ncbi:MAG: hypothetical protein QXS40_05490 [Candidatus Nitrosocaldus sp.]
MKRELIDKLEEGADLLEILLLRLIVKKETDDIASRLEEWVNEVRSMLDTDYYCPICGDILLKRGERIFSCGEHYWKISDNGIVKMKEVERQETKAIPVQVETQEYKLEKEG